MKLSPIVPFEPIRTETFPTGDQWISQVKWDGVRILVYYDGTKVSLINRKLNNRTLQYPELSMIRDYCSAKSVILDGEVIALENGKPSFHKVMKRDGVRKQDSIQLAKSQVPITYMIFDLLYLNGDWVTDRTLLERQQLLNKIIIESEKVQLVKNHNDAETLFNAVTELDLEGIVIKDINSKYTVNGKDSRWQKKKLIKDLVAVVGGVTFRSGTVNALLLGLYDEQGQLWYIGHAGTGKLTREDWRRITETVQNLKIEQRPFVNLPERNKEAFWIRPELTVKVNFMEWTAAKTLRQPSIQAFVDLPANECTFEKNS